MEEMVDIGEKVDLILTDPPYEYNLDGGCGGFKARLVSERNISFISNGFDYERCFNLFLKIQDTPNILIFCSNNQITKTMKFFEEVGLNVTLLVWHKINAIPLCNQKHKSDLEFLVYARGSGAYFNNDVTHDKKSKTEPYLHRCLEISPSTKARENNQSSCRNALKRGTKNF